MRTAQEYRPGPESGNGGEASTGLATRLSGSWVTRAMLAHLRERGPRVERAMLDWCYIRISVLDGHVAVVASDGFRGTRT
jgi:hypothetical protein